MTRELDLDAARSLASADPVARLIDALGRDGDETRVVGGAVRNALLRRHVHEIDLATTADPRETMRRAKEEGWKAVPTGIAHGTVTIVVDGVPFEVTTLREDVETDGRHAVVRFGRDFDGDARRRDFTVNSMSVGRDGILHDTTGGLADLAGGRVRFIGDAGQRIREDYLRVLRFFRFSAEYGEGPVDPEGLDASVRARDGLGILSRERIRSEFLKLLDARRAAEIVELMSETGLVARLTGGVAEPGRFGRAIRGGFEVATLLAALLVTTGEDAERLRDRLRLSNDETDALLVHAQLLARLRSRSTPVDAAETRRLVAEYGVGAVVRTAAILGGEPRPRVSEDAAEQLSRFAEGLEERPVFRLSGADLIRQGLPPGPEIGRRLAEARRAWLAAGCPAE